LEEERAIVLSAGCDDFLRKPFREADIFEIMHKHIGVRYVYEELIKTHVAETDGDELTPENLVALPTELLARFEDATAGSDMDLIESIITKIRLHNVALADGLAKLADMFEYDTILDLIREAQEIQS
jgi:hypothetical protein